jgi:transposase-like protein
MEEIIKNKNYHNVRKYVEKNKDLRFECPDCGRLYGIFSKYHHNKSKYHLNTISILQKKQTIEELENKIEELKKQI